MEIWAENLLNFIIIFQTFFANLLSTKMCNTFWDILYFALTRTQTTKLALKNALHFTSHSLKLASSEKTSKSKVCGTQQQEDACYLVYLIINTTFIILWNKIGFSWKKWESRKQGPKGLHKNLNVLKKFTDHSV